MSRKETLKRIKDVNLEKKRLANNLPLEGLEKKLHEKLGLTNIKLFAEIFETSDSVSVRICSNNLVDNHRFFKLLFEDMWFETAFLGRIFEFKNLKRLDNQDYFYWSVPELKSPIEELIFEMELALRFKPIGGKSSVALVGDVRYSNRGGWSINWKNEE